jgi:maltose alpha-D-glucosyltransferase/alpha-amylase
MPGSKRHSLWYKDAVIYELHVKAFQDSNGDGRGDFRGLIERLDYVQSLGVSAVWLLPFYPSPLRDDGYDISDYRGVHPDYGTPRDFKAFVREAHRRGLRVITELVINHTSDQHPWFQAARRARAGSAKRDYYVWSATDQKFAGTRIIFKDTEHSNWAWDSVAQAYYWHRFFSHQPDLNLNNPRVVREVGRVLRYWFELGVDGLRLDAVPYLCVREGTNNENLPETHEVIRQLRRLVDENYENRLLLAEANQWPADVRPYFGDGDECHMAFHFPLMPRIFMALRQEDRRPITEILDHTPEIPGNCQWALFLRNHDELTLEMVTADERDYMYREYARDSRMRLNLGIRRRLAPLVENSRRRIELLNSLLLSFPGTPVIYYGDEIGMGDNVWLGDRDGVRTPMQWSSDRNAGFSSADPGRLYLPLILDPVYGYAGINVEAQERDPSSLLQFMRRMLALRRQHKAFGRGSFEFLRPRNRKVLVYLRRHRGETILCLANLSRFVQACELDLSEFRGHTPLEMIGRNEFPPIGELPYFFTLGPHNFYWFRLERQAAPIRVSSGVEVEVGALPLLAVDDGLGALVGPDYRYSLANEVIARWIVRQRFFQGKAREIASVTIADSVKLGAGLWLVIADVHYVDQGQETYALPLEVALGESAARVLRDAPSSALARIRSEDGDGVLFDALADQAACGTLVHAVPEGRSWSTAAGGRVRASATSTLETVERPPAADATVRRLGAEQSNTSVIVDESWILKFFRRIEDGPNPDLEIARFLTEGAHFDRFAPVAGGLEYERPGRPTASLAMLQAFVPNEGDGFGFFRSLVRRFLGDVGGRVPAAGEIPADYGRPSVTFGMQPPAALAPLLAPALDAARALGHTTARFHLALAARRRRPDFDAQPVDRDWLERRGDEMERHAGQVLELLESRLRMLPEAASSAAREVLEAGVELKHRLRAIGDLEARAVRIRVHGDYHLGQVLRVGDDFVLIDFEGEPMRPLTRRRQKELSLVDLAGMLRSFGYVTRAARTDAREAPDDPAREAWSRAWESFVSGAFLRAYAQGAEGSSVLPAPPVREILLDAFALEKALYELAYELNNRPDWIAIPLDGIRALVRAARDAESGS